jgi:hypothetical protein
MKEAHPTLLKHIFWKGQHTSKGVLSKFKLGLIFIYYILTSSSLLNLSWAQTHCLTGDEHLGCYSPPPLRESHPEIQGERLSREEKHVIHFPTSAIALGYLASSIWESNLVKTIFLILALRSKFCLKNFLHWLTGSIVTLGGIQDSMVLGTCSWGYG